MISRRYRHSFLLFLALGPASLAAQSLTPTASWTPTATVTFTPDTVNLCCVEEALIGGHGSGVGQLDAPAGLCVSGGILFVADAGNSRIQRYLANGTPVLPPLTGTGPATLVKPFDVCPGLSGQVFVTDQGSSPRAVYRVDLTNSISATVFTSPYFIHGVDVDTDGDVYVSYQNAAPPDSVAKFREFSPGNYAQVAVLTAFDQANDVLAVGNGSELLVADTGNDRVLRYAETSPGSDAYALASVVIPPCPGDPSPGCVRWPYQLARGGGLLHVTDIGFRIQAFDAAGNWLYQCVPPAPLQYGTLGVGVDSLQSVYVAIRGEPGGDVVRKTAPCAVLPSPWTPTATPTAPATQVLGGCDDGDWAFHTYPNPVRGGVLNVYFEACYAGNTEFQVFNAASDLVLKQSLRGRPGPNRFVVDARKLATGVYYAQVEKPNAVGGRGNSRIAKFAVVR